MNRYHRCFVWQTEKDAVDVQVIAKSRDGAVVEVVGKVMYFPDEFTFDHINYHYRMKISPERRPEIKQVSELTNNE